MFLCPYIYRSCFQCPFHYSKLLFLNWQTSDKTQNQFIIEPLFSVEESNGTVKPIVVAFDVKHLGTKIKKRMYLYKDIPAFSEINDY